MQPQRPKAPDQAIADPHGGESSADVVLGEVVGVHGVRGAVKVYSATRPRENIFDYPVWTLVLNGQSRDYAVLGSRQQGKGLIATLAGVSDRDSAMALRGHEIRVPRQQLPAAESGEVYWADLQGLEVINVDGSRLGVVTGLMETGANDVLVVDGDRERLIPYVPDRHVLEVDLTAGQLRVDWDPEF